MNKAKWIWLNKNNTPDEFVVFYDEFSCSDEKVFIDISVAGDYTLYINEKLVAFDQYADYAHFKVYDKIEISEFVKAGKNQLKLIAWHIGLDAFNGYSFGTGAIYEVYDKKSVLCYSKEGTPCGLYKGYQSYNKKLITAQVGYSYTADTRYDGADQLTGAVEIDNLTYDLNLRPNLKLVFGEKLVGKLIDADKGLYDLGKNCAGFLYIKIKGESGKKVEIEYGEHVTDGEVRAKIESRDFSVEIICNGGVAEVLGTFRRLGCRYLQVNNKAVEVLEIAVIETNYPFKWFGYKADSELRQKIYDVSQRTLQLCAHEHYEDCPWREQGQYLLDSRNQMLFGYYAYENIEFQRAAIELFSKGQRENGLFDICFPSKCEFTIPSFTLMFPWIILEYTERVKDIDFAKKFMPQLEKMLAYFTDKIDKTGLFKTVTTDDVWNFYEWIDDLDSNFFSEDPKEKYRNGYDSLINAYISLSLEKTACLYDFIGDKESATRLRKIKEGLNEAIFENFYCKETSLFKTYLDKDKYSVLANSLCILCGACPKDLQGVVAEKIVSEDKLLIKNTLSMNVFRFDALLSVDKEKYTPYVLSQIDSIYGKMLDAGATTFWETELGEKDFNGAGSLCHGWSAIPIYYYKTLLK